MQRSLWKGAISFGLVHIPVHLYSAENSHGLDLDMLDKRDFAPIGYKRVNKSTGREVTWENIVKGYEYESGQYVVLSDEDLKRANVKATGTIDILSFVDADEVPPTYFEKPYYLTPDKGGDKVYALLRETLRRSNRIAIAQIVLRTKQHLVSLFPVDNMIVLNTLRYADEIRDIKDYDLPEMKRGSVGEKEVQLALSLVDGMTEHWDPKQYHDTYRDDVMALVEKKIKANQTRTLSEPEAEEQTPAGGAQIIDLMSLLKQSLGGKGAAKANGATAKKTARANGEAAKKTAAKSGPGNKSKAENGKTAKSSTSGKTIKKAASKAPGRKSASTASAAGTAARRRA